MSDKWLVFAEGTDPWMEQLNISYNSKFLVAHKQANNIKLTEWYKISYDGRMQKTELGQWNEQGLEISRIGFLRRRFDFQGAQFTYLITNFNSCSHLSFESWNVFLCIQHTIWNTIVQQLNITALPTLSESREPEYLVEMFKNGLAQASVNGWSITSFSLKHVSFMWPTFLTVLQGFTRVESMSYGWDRYLKPFTKGIWLVAAGWVVLCSSSILFYQAIAYNLKLTSTRDGAKCRREQIWTPLFAFLAQGCSEPTTCSSERLFILTAMTVPLVVIPAYSAALTSFLAIQVPATPLRDINGLLDHPEHSISSVRTLDIRPFFQGTDIISQYIYNYSIPPLHEQPEDELAGVKKMCTDKFTFVAADVPVAALKPPCQYYKMRKPIIVFYQSLTLPKNSPYKTAFDTVIRNMEFSGVTAALKKKTTLKVTLPTMTNKGSPVLDVSIEEVAVLLASLAFAILISLTMLLCEFVSFPMKKGPRIYPFLL